MNTAWAEVWCGAMWRAGWQGGAALLVVWGVCAVFGRGGPWVKCWLWRLGYVKFLVALCVGASIGLPVLPARLVAATGGVGDGVEGRAAMPGADTDRAPAPAVAGGGNSAHVVGERSLPAAELGGGSVNGAMSEPPRAAVITPVHVAAEARGATIVPMVGVVLFAAWVLGVWLAGVRVICAWIRTGALRRGAVRVAEGALVDLLGRLAAEVGVRRVPALLVAGDVTGPLLTGVFRPAILLPAGLAADMHSEALRLALMHELAHVRRRDIWWNVLHCTVEMVFFFHPLMWVGRRQARYWQELACDHLTLKASGVSPAAYGKALLGIVALQRVPSPVLAGVGVADSVRTLRRRLMAMSTFRRSSSGRVVLAAVLVSVVAVGGILPWRLVAQSSVPVAPVAAASAPATTSAASGSAGVRSSAASREALAPAAVPAASGGVIAHWSFDALDENGNYPDSVGNAHPATPVDKNEVLAYNGPAPAPFGKAVTLQGPLHPNSYMTIPPLTNIHTTSFTVAAWVNLASQNSAFVIADWPSMAQSAYAFGFHPFGPNKNTAQPNGNITSTEMITGRSSQRKSIISQKLPDRGISLNEWHHVVWVWDREAATMTFYYDGANWGEAKRNPVPPGSSYSTSLDMAVNNLPVRIGSQQMSVDNRPANLTGSMDELWIFAEPLTPIQIRNLREYNDVRGKPAPVMPVGAGGVPAAGPASAPTAVPGTSAAVVAADTPLTDTPVTRSITIRTEQPNARQVYNELVQRFLADQNTKVQLDDRAGAIILNGTSANVHRLAEIMAYWEYQGVPRARSGNPSVAGPVPAQALPAAVYQISGMLRVPVADIQSALDGRMMEVAVKEGQRVKAGEALFKLDDRDAKAAVQLAEINLDNAVVAFKDKKARADAGGPTGDVSQAENQVAVAKIQLERAKNALDDLVIRSPIDGTVQTFDVRPNQMITRGTRITTVAGSELQVNMAVPTGQMRDLRVGQKFTLGVAGEPLATGEITYISTVEDSPSSTYFVRGKILSGDRIDRLRSGMSATVYVTAEK